MRKKIMKIDVSIITFTMGREVYLKKCINSVFSDMLGCDLKYEHHIIFQGVAPSRKIRLLYDSLPNVVLHEWPKNIGVANGLNEIIPKCNGELIFKMDEDCKIVSEYLIEKAFDIYNRFPNIVFSPFPVGLINNKGGPIGVSHFVYKKDDSFYTFRKVQHLGGFARFAPKYIYQNFKFELDLINGISGNEDGQFSLHCIHNNIGLYYLENNLIVEHQESTYGQIARYPEYFSNRKNESSININIVE